MLCAKQKIYTGLLTFCRYYSAPLPAINYSKLKIPFAFSLTGSSAKKRITQPRLAKPEVPLSIHFEYLVTSAEFCINISIPCQAIVPMC